MEGSWNLRHRSTGLRDMQTPVKRLLARPRLIGHLRNLASSSQPEKSWSELAGDAFQIAKTAANKVVTGIQETAGKLLPSRDEESPQTSGRRDQYDNIRYGQTPNSGSSWPWRNDSFGGLSGGGLFGNILGRIAQVSIDDMEELRRKNAREGADLKHKVLALLQADSRVEEALGRNVQIAPGNESQFVSTSYVNGQTKNTVTLGFTITGDRGNFAYAQAKVLDGNETDAEIMVRLQNGSVVCLDFQAAHKRNATSSSKPIDVEWREIK